MATGSQVRAGTGASRRRVPRFQMQAPLDVTVLRSGIPDTLPGRSVNLCERGIAAMLAGELVPGEAVGIQVQLPKTLDPLRARAMVRYQDKLRCGLEFVGLSAEQRAIIRGWAKESKAQTEISATPTPAGISTGVSAEGKKGADAGQGRGRISSGGTPPPPVKKWTQRGRAILLGFLVLVMLAGAALWWRWNRGWNELESGVRNPATASSKEAPTEVSTEVMQKLLVHKVDPTYPPEARQANLQGVIALDIVVGRDGSVVSTHALNGPEVLARAATDALRWWKFEPYRVNGEPAVVETTMAVEFKP
jgi:TonB family protein